MSTKKKSSPKVKDPKAEFYRKAETASWQKLQKGEGGKLSDVSKGEFKYPADLTRRGSIIFSDGKIMDVEKRQVRNGNYVELLKEIKKSSQK